MADEEERRYAPDGGHYTYDEFYQFYNREDEWHAADPNAQESWKPEVIEVGEDSSSDSDDSDDSGVDSEDTDGREARIKQEESRSKRVGFLRNGPWQLDVQILHARGLHEVGDGQATMSETNPFVVMKLNNVIIGKTKTQRRTRNPNFDWSANTVVISGRSWLASTMGLNGGVRVSEQKSERKESKESRESRESEEKAQPLEERGWEDSDLTFEVYDWDRLAAHRLLGSVTLDGSRLANLVDGIRREVPIEKKKNSGEGGNSDSEEDSDEEDSGSDSGSSSDGSLASKKKKPKVVVHIDHFVQEDFLLEEKQEVKKKEKKEGEEKEGEGGEEGGERDKKNVEPVLTHRQLRLVRLRKERDELSSVVVEGTLTIRVTLRAPNAVDVDSTADQHDADETVALTDRQHGRRKAVGGGGKENDDEKHEEDEELRLTPLEELFIAIDRDHVGSITKGELLRSLTRDSKVAKLLQSHHFSRMGFQLLYLPRLFKEAWKIMDPKETGEVPFDRFVEFERHMQSTRAPNRLLLRMIYDTLLFETMRDSLPSVQNGKRPSSWSSGNSWLRKRTIRDGLTRNKRCVRLLQRAKQFQALSYDRIFGESLMLLSTSRSGYVSFEEFHDWARQLESERTERLALVSYIFSSCFVCVFIVFVLFVYF